MVFFNSHLLDWVFEKSQDIYNSPFIYTKLSLFVLSNQAFHLFVGSEFDSRFRCDFKYIDTITTPKTSKSALVEQIFETGDNWWAMRLHLQEYFQSIQWCCACSWYRTWSFNTKIDKNIINSQFNNIFESSDSIKSSYAATNLPLHQQPNVASPLLSPAHLRPHPNTMNAAKIV